MALYLFLFFICGALFSEVMDEIWVDKQLLPLDQSTSQWMALNQETYDRLFFLIITYMAEGGVLAVLTLLIGGGLWFYRKKLESILLIGGFGTTGVLLTFLKFWTDRMRPEGAKILDETSGSFPSAHAALSLFFFGFIAYLLSRTFEKKLYGALTLVAGFSIAGLIGLSRIYLNVHWLSDILGGYALAAAILSLCIGVMETQKLEAKDYRRHSQQYK